MRSGESPFIWSDAWVLLSLIYARGPSSREYIRTVGDFINHAIFTDEELEGGLKRLTAAGHAQEVNDLFQPTLSVLDWYKKAAPSRHRSVNKDLERVEKFLGVPTDRK